MPMDVRLPDEFIKSLQDLGNGLDTFAPEMLDRGMDILNPAIRKNLLGHKRSGQLIESMTRTKPNKKNNAWRIQTTFKGAAKGKSYTRRRSGKSTSYRNYQKVLALEFGTSKQKATPVIRPAVLSSEAKVINEMQNTFEQEAIKRNLKL